MIDLNRTLEAPPPENDDKFVHVVYPDSTGWVEWFAGEHLDRIRRENKSSTSRVQDVLILLWLERMGGFVGSEEDYIAALSHRVWQRERREYRTNVKRRQVESDVLWSRLLREAEVMEQSVEDVIECAPEEYRQILEWKFIAGYTNAEIASLLNTTDRTVRRWTRVAYQTIRNSYS